MGPTAERERKVEEKLPGTNMSSLEVDEKCWPFRARVEFPYASVSGIRRYNLSCLRRWLIGRGVNERFLKENVPDKSETEWYERDVETGCLRLKGILDWGEGVEDLRMKEDPFHPCFEDYQSTAFGGITLVEKRQVGKGENAKIEYVPYSAFMSLVFDQGGIHVDNLTVLRDCASKNATPWRFNQRAGLWEALRRRDNDNIDPNRTFHRLQVGLVWQNGDFQPTKEVLIRRHLNPDKPEEDYNAGWGFPPDHLESGGYLVSYHQIQKPNGTFDYSQWRGVTDDELNFMLVGNRPFLTREDLAGVLPKDAPIGRELWPELRKVVYLVGRELLFGKDYYGRRLKRWDPVRLPINGGDSNTYGLDYWVNQLLGGLTPNNGRIITVHFKDPRIFSVFKFESERRDEKLMSLAV